VLGFVALFKLGEAMAATMAAPFFNALGFDRAAIALANGEISLLATLAGAALGGVLVARLGVGRALIWTAWGQMLSNGTYVLLALSAGNETVLYAAVTVEALTDGMVDAAFIAYLSGLTSVAFSATQYALLSSLAAVASRSVGGLSGFLAAALGWAWFYALTMLAALPAMLIMVSLLRRFPPDRPAARS
jgi:PAT family beta-lactamase induction signal transducer AmpG